MDEKPDEKRSRDILIFVCLVMFFDAMGVGLILPVLPDLIRELSDVSNDRAAEIGGYLLFTFAAMQFLFAPVLGGLSDRFGRRPVLLLALLGFSLDYFVMAAAPTLAFLFVARMISGLFGATYPAANAAIVDISSPEERAKFFGFTGAAVGLGFIMGPAIGGLIGEYGARLPFVLAGILTLATCVYGYIRFPETLAPEKRRALDWKRANPFGSLIKISAYPIVLAVLGSIFLIQLANQSYVSIWSFYTIEVAGWSPFWIGLSAAFYGFMLVLVQGGMTGPVIKKYGEIAPTYFSLLIGIVSYSVLALAWSGPVIYLGILIGGFSGFLFPATQALMTRRTPEDAQGELQGAISANFSIASIIGPLLMTQVFERYTGSDASYVLPGAPFVIAILLTGAALLVFVFAARAIKAEA